jgi:hypothetical protein
MQNDGDEKIIGDDVRSYAIRSLLHLVPHNPTPLQPSVHDNTTLITSVATSVVFVILALLFLWRHSIRQTKIQPCFKNIGPRFNVFRSHKIFCHGADNSPPLPPQTPTLEIVPMEGQSPRLTRRKSANSHVDDLGIRRVYSGNSARVDMTRVTYEANLQQLQISDVYPKVQGPHQHFPGACTRKIEAKSGH